MSISVSGVDPSVLLLYRTKLYVKLIIRIVDLVICVITLPVAIMDRTLINLVSLGLLFRL